MSRSRYPLVLVLAGLAACGAARSAAAPPSIAWQKSLPAALSRAAGKKQLVMADFYTDWCGYCKKLDREVFTNAKVIRALRDFAPVKLNAEKEGRAAARRYRVDSFPTILFLDGKGKAIAVLPGFVPAEGFLDALRQAREIHRKGAAARR